MRSLLLAFTLILLTVPCSVPAQRTPTRIKLFDFDEGLSHRITAKVAQDEAGFIWLATINGLNRFDGHDFIVYNSQSEEHYIPFDAINDLLLTKDGGLWLACPDHLVYLDTQTGETKTIKVKDGPSVARESLVLSNLYLDEAGKLWAVAYDERSALSQLIWVSEEGELHRVTSMKGQYPQRPLVQMGDFLFVGAHDEEIWQLTEEGKKIKTFKAPLVEGDRVSSLAVHNNRLHVLSINGTLSLFDPSTGQFSPHPATSQMESATALMIEPDGHVWIGGRGTLQYYDALLRTTTDYSPAIQATAKNICTYRQVFRDEYGVVWIASDFGAIKLVQRKQLFDSYLKGGDENCSNVFCSMRGMAEDDAGNIYFSYYSSIHVLDPASNITRPLFADRGFFNSPFGLTYYDGALWTGNGKRIDLRTKQVKDVLKLSEKDLGHVCVGKDSLLWMGYLHHLYQYDPRTEQLKEFEDMAGRWDSINGNISYLLPGRQRDGLWVATLGNGLYWIDSYQERQDHYFNSKASPAPLQHNQVNALYEDRSGRLWIGTAAGLHCLYPQRDSIKVYTTQEGLPNDFINGILSEGDTCIWVSTNNGLCRLNVETGQCASFFTSDGLSANEFNRISFLRARNGRMYFGGLNGVNAFYPGPQFVEREEVAKEAPMMFTKFSKFDGLSDSLIVQTSGLATGQTITLSPWDHVFSFGFALANYQNVVEHLFSYKLEGYDQDWSETSKIREVRYNNIPAGEYTFRVRAKPDASAQSWGRQELALSVVIQEAFYRTWWFWALTVLLVFTAVTGFLRYRYYLAQRRQRELEALVKERTQELEKEKQKSEELLLNILPLETAEELKANGSAKAKRHELVTVMFSDFKGFSKISEQMDPEDLVAEIDHCFCGFDEIMDKYNLEKIKTVGDAYLCVGGMHENDDGHEAVRVTTAALEIQEFMRGLALQRQSEGKPYFEARIGIHTGPVVAGIVGIKKFAYDIWGDTVNLAARMETHGAVGKVNVSETAYGLIRDTYPGTYHASYTETEGEDIKMYFVDTNIS